MEKVETYSSVQSFEELSGFSVKNGEGEDLGKIEDLAIDVASGRIAYAVLSFGGLLGIGNKYFAVPWEALTLHGNEVILLDVDKEKLKNAPGFDKDDWPDMADRQWGASIYTYYGRTPYWDSTPVGRY